MDGCDRGWHIAQAASRAGLAFPPLQSAMAAGHARFDAKLTENDRELRAAGHWGVPTMVFENEPFFGQDRFDILLWGLEQRGLASTSGSPRS